MGRVEEWEVEFTQVFFLCGKGRFLLNLTRLYGHVILRMTRIYGQREQEIKNE